MQLVFVVSGTVLAWAIMLGALYLTHNLPRVAFVSLHYLLNIFIFTFLAVVLRRVGGTYTAWAVTVAVVGILVALNFFYGVFETPEVPARFLPFIDWFIPAILVFATVYLVARLVR